MPVNTDMIENCNINNKKRIEQCLAERGVYVSTTVGMSMFPMLRNRRDTIIVSPVTGRLKKYDVPLYRRGNDYVLHRIVKVTESGYVICGDNCLYREHGITDEQILGVLSGFYRENHVVDMSGWGYRLYCRVWVAVYPVRFVLKWTWINGKKVVKRCISR